jgi:hypothetical protein
LIILDPFKDKRIIDVLARARFHIDLIGTILLPVSSIYILSIATEFRVKAGMEKRKQIGKQEWVKPLPNHDKAESRYS